MYQKNVEVGCRQGFEKITALGDAGRDQPIMNAPIFFGREDMLADRQVVCVAINKLKGQHRSHRLRRFSR